MGFTVMVSLADTTFSGDRDARGLPRAGMQRAAVNLANMFQDDRGVMLELFVELWPPAGTTVSARQPDHNAWNIYINGGGDDKGDTFVGVNSIIRQMRETNATNLIVVEGGIPGFCCLPETRWKLSLWRHHRSHRK